MKKRDPKIPADILGNAYPLGNDPDSRKKRFVRYLLEAAVLPIGIVILELYIAFYKSWDSETYNVNIPTLLISFAVVYVLSLIWSLTVTEAQVRRYREWKKSTFHVSTDSNS